MWRSSFCVCFSTCAESTHSCPSASIPSSFSLFLMSGLAALISILRLDVGVQGSTEPTSLPFLGVVRGPMTKKITWYFLWWICRNLAYSKVITLNRLKKTKTQWLIWHVIPCWQIYYNWTLKGISRSFLKHSNLDISHINWAFIAMILHLIFK